MKGIATVFAFALLMAAGASSALAADPPMVEVAPSLVFNGQMANVSGSGFCPTGGGCSTVSIAVETKPVATASVDSAGKFRTTFTVSQFSGSYHVTATQSANGSTLQATGGMTVALTDTRRTSPTPPGGGVVNPPAPKTTASPPNPIGTAPPSDSPVADASPAVQPTATNGGPLRPATAAVNPALNVGIAILLLLLVAAAVVGAILWRRRRESG